MNMSKLVWRELFERKRQMLMCFFAILLGITVVVAIKNITFFSEQAVAEDMEALGANLLILPKETTLQDYYAAKDDSALLSEDHVDKIAASGFEGVEGSSPKLNFTAQIGGQAVTLSGIVPQDELKAKAAWGGINVFKKCPISGKKKEPQPAANKQVIDALQADEIILGADIAPRLAKKPGETVALLGQTFKVAQILPPTGTVDDSRVFLHLRAAQKLAGKERQVSVVEVAGCCNEIAQGLVGKLESILPASLKVVTITQIVATQQNINEMMANLSLIFLIIIVFVGGAGIANYMYANVNERQAEIGTLMAIGAKSGLVLRIFLLKAFILGVAGGIGGYIIGTAAAMVLGPRLAGVAIMPMPILGAWALAISLVVTVLASYFPARHAARLDPVETLQEV